MSKVIRYTPDIFAGPLMGYYLDRFPGIEGHQIVFGFLTIFSMGMSCSRPSSSKAIREC